MANKTVGILGGMGPEATVDLMSKIIRLLLLKQIRNILDYWLIIILRFHQG